MANSKIIVVEGAQGAGKQDLRCARAADHAGTPPVQRITGKHQRSAGPHPAHGKRSCRAGCSHCAGAGGGRKQLLPPRCG